MALPPLRMARCAMNDWEDERLRRLYPEASKADRRELLGMPLWVVIVATLFVAVIVLLEGW